MAVISSELVEYLADRRVTALVQAVGDLAKFVPGFYNAHVLQSPLDQSRIVSPDEYAFYHLHGNKIRTEAGVEDLTPALLKNGRSEIVIISDSSALHGFLALACLAKAGNLVLLGEATEFADRFLPFFETSESLNEFRVLGNFHGTAATRHVLESFLMSPQEPRSVESEISPQEIPASGCSSFKEEISVNFAGLDERVKSKIYLKKKFPETISDPIRSSPYLADMTNANFAFPASTLASLAPLDVLKNSAGVQTDVRYSKISESVNFKLRNTTSDGQKFDLLYAEDIFDLAKLSGLNQGGDCLFRLRSPWVLEFSEAAWVMRLALLFRSVSLVRSALDPRHSFVFAESFHKQRRLPLQPVLEQVALSPDFVKFVENFNFRVSLDAKRNAHARPPLNDLKFLDARTATAPFFVYYGSFDPVHENHATLVASLAENAQVAVVPNRGENENKLEISEYRHRLEMARLRFQGIANVRVFETSETTETWASKERIAREIGERIFEDRPEYFDLHLMLGEDSFKKATSWKKSGLLKVSCKICVFPREGEQLDVPRELAERVVVQGNHVDPFPGLCSSKLRRLISRGENFPSEWLDARVLEYARSHALFEAAATHEDLFPDSD